MRKNVRDEFRSLSEELSDSMIEWAAVVTIEMFKELRSRLTAAYGPDPRWDDLPSWVTETFDEFAAEATAEETPQ